MQYTIWSPKHNCGSTKQQDYTPKQLWLKRSITLRMDACFVYKSAQKNLITKVALNMSYLFWVHPSKSYRVLKFVNS